MANSTFEAENSYGSYVVSRLASMGKAYEMAGFSVPDPEDVMLDIISKSANGSDVFTPAVCYWMARTSAHFARRRYN